MKGENYYEGGKGLYQEPIPPFTLIRVVRLTLEEVSSFSEQFRSWAVYHAEGSDAVLVAGHHEYNVEKFPFLNVLKGRVIGWEKVNGWPRGFSHIVIPPSQRGLNLTPHHK